MNNNWLNKNIRISDVIEILSLSKISSKDLLWIAFEIKSKVEEK